MAEALLERIESDALRDYEVKKGYLLVLPSGYWEDLKRECGL